MSKKQTLNEIDNAIGEAESYIDPVCNGTMIGYAKASAIGIRYLVSKSHQNTHKRCLRNKRVSPHQKVNER